MLSWSLKINKLLLLHLVGLLYYFSNTVYQALPWETSIVPEMCGIGLLFAFSFIFPFPQEQATSFVTILVNPGHELVSWAFKIRFNIIVQVSIVTNLGGGRRGDRTTSGSRYFFLSNKTRPSLGLTLPSNQCDLGAFSAGLTTHIHLAPRLRLSGGVPPLPLYYFKACTWTTLSPSLSIVQPLTPSFPNLHLQPFQLQIY